MLQTFFRLINSAPAGRANSSSSWSASISEGRFNLQPGVDNGFVRQVGQEVIYISVWLGCVCVYGGDVVFTLFSLFFL